MEINVPLGVNSKELGKKNIPKRLFVDRKTKVVIIKLNVEVTLQPSSSLLLSGLNSTAPFSHCETSWFLMHFFKKSALGQLGGL